MLHGLRQPAAVASRKQPADRNDQWRKPHDEQHVETSQGIE